ncbi:hypothetical protein ACWOE5_05760 [Aerococcus sanguinicola]|uniref:Uncharacterized protein n=1 Tax=Aerococcus sanguinicola TaxID=119206 RepID=A0A0X8FB36_9LACT|nr:MULTISPECIES: hypothetical protein [Aerococcus]AMB94068.1 hypothetical protein AWM72_04500 [Aerococcus sanguinicola]MDK7050240.1 hypothetical protein [Aerococcus sanguinicola]OFT92838.1 hypothetical protein HMPREF3090_08010 [Aerococcus sp. HMSC23C02]PKZ22158.1 hypothetical protein CYJ28_03315 [Aerococcus sanguinicola]
MELSQDQVLIRRLKRFAIFFLVINVFNAISQLITTISSFQAKDFDPSQFEMLGQEMVDQMKQTFVYAHSTPVRLMNVVYLLLYLALVFIFYKEWQKLRDFQIDPQTKTNFVIACAISLAIPLVNALLTHLAGLGAFSAMAGWIWAAIVVVLNLVLFGICFYTYKKLADQGAV